MPPAKPEPGRDPQMAERTRQLNVVFALSSLALLVIFTLMIWADYDREWKRYQVEFNRLEVQLTQSQIEQALGKVDAARRQALDTELQQAAQEREANAQQISQARAEVDRLQGEWYGIDQNFRFTKARMDVARYGYDEAVHQKHDAAGARKRLDDLEKRWNDWRLKLEDVIARRDAASGRLGELEKVERAAEAARKELYAERDRLEERLRKIQPGVVSFVRNLPVLDMANPSLRVNQIMPANLYDDVVF